MTEQPKPRRRSRPLANLIGLLIAIPVLYVAYALNYHYGPPIPQLDDFFANIRYDLTPPEPVFPDTVRSILPESVDPDFGDGFYYWELTNTNDFAWPGAYVAYGENHTFGLERVDPGETVGIWNVQHRNTATGEIEPVRWEPGESVELTLYIDFSEEDSLQARVKKLFRLTVGHYPLGGWTRHAEGE